MISRGPTESRECAKSGSSSARLAMHMGSGSRIYVAGHRGLVGSALMRRLVADGCTNIVYRTHRELDLEDRHAVFDFFAAERPEYVILSAAKVGGIRANDTYPADFIRSNLAIQCNVIEAAHRFGVTTLLFLGSSCIYPKHAQQPIREEYLLSGPLEPTNQPYAIAKIAGIEMCQAYHRQYGSNFISVMPTNLYGPGDNFDLDNSHVLPALIRKFHEAKVSGDRQVVVWGTGRARREFLHVDDMVDACMFLLERYHNPLKIVNIGCGEDISISELAAMIKDVVGYEGAIAYDASKPDGTPRKLLNVSLLAGLGWKPTVPLRDGIMATYCAYVRSIGAEVVEPPMTARVAGPW
jgi:GDP-L-fucose synthase